MSKCLRLGLGRNPLDWARQRHARSRTARWELKQQDPAACIGPTSPGRQVWYRWCTQVEILREQNGCA